MKYIETVEELQDQQVIFARFQFEQNKLERFENVLCTRTYFDKRASCRSQLNNIPREFIMKEPRV